MRDYINRNIRIDGRLIPYPVYTSWEYFELHDGIEDVEDFVDSNPAIELKEKYNYNFDDVWMENLIGRI